MIGKIKEKSDGLSGGAIAGIIISVIILIIASIVIIVCCKKHNQKDAMDRNEAASLVYAQADTPSPTPED